MIRDRLLLSPYGSSLTLTMYFPPSTEGTVTVSEVADVLLGVTTV